MKVLVLHVECSQRIRIAGCGSGPKNIVDSMNEARAAGDAALAQLNPILLDGEQPEGEATSPPDDEMRVQIEKLLHALIDRPNAG